MARPKATRSRSSPPPRWWQAFPAASWPTARQGDKGANFHVEAVLKKAEGLAKGDELITKVAGDVRTMAEANSKAVCYWQYYCYWNGYCEYAYYCY